MVDCISRRRGPRPSWQSQNLRTLTNTILPVPSHPSNPPLTGQVRRSASGCTGHGAILFIPKTPHHRVRSHGESSLVDVGQSSTRIEDIKDGLSPRIIGTQQSAIPYDQTMPIRQTLCQQYNMRPLFLPLHGNECDDNSLKEESHQAVGDTDSYMWFLAQVELKQLWLAGHQEFSGSPRRNTGPASSLVRKHTGCMPQ